MNALQAVAVARKEGAAGPRILRRLFANVGRWAIGLWRPLVELSSVGTAVIWQSLRPLTWRRTVRAEFLLQCYQNGIRALPLISLSGVIIGLGMVFQALYWLKLFGQSDILGRFLALVLVREIAPLLVGFIVIGRSGSVIMVELGNMKVGRQVHMLDAQGIDPFVYLVVPRVIALSVSVFSLNIVFIMVALGAGLVAGNALDVSNVAVFEVIKRLLNALGPVEYAMILLKTLLTGFVVALICCTTALAVPESETDVQDILPRGFVKSVLATFLISGAVTLLM